jgi:hypothetical protein
MEKIVEISEINKILEEYVNRIKKWKVKEIRIIIWILISLNEIEIIILFGVWGWWWRGYNIYIILLLRRKSGYIWENRKRIFIFMRMYIGGKFNIIYSVFNV